MASPDHDLDLPDEPPVDVGFFTVAAPRAASTWFTRCVDEHPELHVGSHGEKNFFFRSDRTHLGDPRCPREEQWAHYRDLYHDPEPPAPDAMLGDTSVNLLYDTERAPQLLRDLYPDAKLMLLVRDPVARSHSEYWYFQWGSRTMDLKPFGEGVRNPPFDPDGSLREHLRGEHDPFDEAVRENPIIERSRYHTYLEPWLDVWPRDQVEAFFHLDLKEDPEAFYRDVFRFLEVEPGFRPPTLDEQVNESRKREGWFATLEEVAVGLRRAGLDPVMDAVNKVGLADAIRDLGWSSPEKPDLDPETEAILRERFEPEVEGLEEVFGRDLSAWKPD